MSEARRAWRWAHPRSRGENVRTYVSESSTTGSSPLTRGKLLMTGNAVKRIGLIPAHAGKTCVAVSWMR